MKRTIFGLLVVGLFFLGACSQNSTNTSTIKVASVGSDAEIWQFIADSDAAKKADVNIEVSETEGGVITNRAVANGDVDANAFQSLGYMDSFNTESGTKLVPIAATYIEPMGIYSESIKSIDDIPDGATVALAEEPAITTRSLRLLEAAELIKLKPDFDDGVGTIDDISENPKNLTFTLVNERMVQRALPDVDLGVIGNTIALEGGLNVLDDSIYREEVSASNPAIINVIAVQEGREGDENLKKLGELYHDPEVQAFIEEKFEGTKVPVELPIEEIWQK